MNLRLNYTLRSIPLVLYGLLIIYASVFQSFDFWTPMINLNKNFINWFLAGVYNVLLVFLLLYIRLMVIRFSFQDLNEKIPHSDAWEHFQFYMTILFTLLVIVNGLLLTTFIYSSTIFQNIDIGLIIIPLLIDLVFHLKWILL